MDSRAPVDPIALLVTVANRVDQKTKRIWCWPESNQILDYLSKKFMQKRKSPSGDKCTIYSKFGPNLFSDEIKRSVIERINTDNNLRKR